MRFVVDFDGSFRHEVAFDGIRFQIFLASNAPGLASNSIFRLIAPADGTLWIGTDGGGLGRLRHHHEHRGDSSIRYACFSGEPRLRSGRLP